MLEGKPESSWRGPDGRLHYYSNVREGKKPHEITSARLARKALARLGYEHETVTARGTIARKGRLESTSPTPSYD